MMSVLFWSAHKILVLIASLRSEGLNELGHPHNLSGAFTSCILNHMKEDGDSNHILDCQAPLCSCACMFSKVILRRHLVHTKKITFLCLNQNIFCGCSKEPSQRVGSFKHPKHMLKLMGKKILTNLSPKTLFDKYHNLMCWPIFFSIMYCRPYSKVDCIRCSLLTKMQSNN